MKNKGMLDEIPVLAVYFLVLLNINYGQLQPFDYILLALIVINLFLLYIRYFKRRR